ncbi:hypothetical protein [Candidatus Leptofilum sp.]|uniref:hypothetical protein n=1 Tax=Candidatus Leptofilum sp. TaxID=3241576 RepID=UPI003B5BAAEF
MQLPKVRGANLARQTLTFPEDFAGALNLVFVAFQQWQQRDVDGWVPLAEDLYQHTPDFEYYEFPTIQRVNFLARTFINKGMRAGIPNEATRRRTITLYIDKRPFKQALNISTEDQIWVFLFDAQGRVLWHSSGAFTQEKGIGLQTAVASQLVAI